MGQKIILDVQNYKICDCNWVNFALNLTKTRVFPFLRDRILTHIKEDDTVLIAAHGNSLRSIIMQLENLTPEEVPKLELATGAPIVFEFDS